MPGNLLKILILLVLFFTLNDVSNKLVSESAFQGPNDLYSFWKPAPSSVF